jgi:hypothetical protein
MQVLVLRPLLFRGEAFTAGQVLEVEPIEAAELQASGRARLADPADQQQVATAVEKQTAALMKRMPYGGAGTFPSPR